MDSVRKFIDSGILELYVLEQTSSFEQQEVEVMASMHEEVRLEIDEISKALLGYARGHAIEPDPMVLPFLMARIDYMERLKNGEQPSFPPVLNKDSKISDYDEWLNRPDLQLDKPLDQVMIRIIGFTPDVSSAIVWLQHGAPPETHTDELEQFLIVEGTCEIVIGQQVNHMKPGDVLIVPLHQPHYVKVTSDIPCKILLQRVAA